MTRISAIHFTQFIVALLRKKGRYFYSLIYLKGATNIS